MKEGPKDGARPLMFDGTRVCYEVPELVGDWIRDRVLSSR